MFLKRKNERYEKGKLVKDKFYFGGLLILKKLYFYKKDASSYTTFLFGLPVWRSYIAPEKFVGLLQYKKSGKRFLECSHYMTQDIAKALNEDGDIKNKIQKLCDGLDRQSIECVNRIIARLKQSYVLKDKKWFELTQEEKEEILKIEKEFYPNIMEVGESIYFYKGWFLPKNAFEISVFWHKHSLEMIENWDDICQKSIIDVGGFIGDSAILLQDYTKEKVYSFEAVQDNYETMLKTIELNNATKITPVKKALGSKKEKLQISIKESGSSIKFDTNSFGSEEIDVITLDEFVTQNNIKVGFIKVDIEGFEMEFLKGALQTIKNQKPAMLISIYHQASDFFGIKPFIEELDLGYKFKIHKPIDYSVSGETALFCEVR